MNRPSRPEFSEYEAARLLGVSVEQLRGLVRDHVVIEDSGKQDTPQDAGDKMKLLESPLPTYRASDLVVLRVLAGLAPRASI